MPRLGPRFDVSRASSKNPIYGAFVEAGVEAGYRRTSDFNGFQQEGFGPYQLTIKNGRRWSASFQRAVSRSIKRLIMATNKLSSVGK